jgi:uncharacterized protein YfiM (DUF2279 family)
VNLCLVLVCMALPVVGESTSRASIPSEWRADPAAPRADRRAADRWVAEDKFQHFFASFAITVLAAGAGRTAGLGARDGLMVGAGAGVGAGVWKEIRDAGRPGGHFSVRDLVWDLAGVGAGIVVAAQAR